MKKDLGILQALLRDFRRAIKRPEISKALLFSRGFFHDELIRAAALAVLLNDGDWKSAKRDLSGVATERRAKLFAWADKIVGGVA